jgi:hypothetical protein
VSARAALRLQAHSIACVIASSWQSTRLHFAAYQPLFKPFQHTISHLYNFTCLPQGPKQHFTFGPAFGQQAHYGHFDVIVGRNAQQEVWPHLTAFLEAHDAPASLRQLWDARLLNEGEV